MTTTSKKPTLTATLPDGKQVTRTTAHDYKFVVALRSVAMTNGQWADHSWVSRLDLAQKEARRVGGYNGILEVAIVEVGGHRN